MPPGVAALGLPSAGAADRSPPAIDWNDEKSSPAQNDSPSPDSTTTRTRRLRLQLLAGVAQPGEHRPVERVALLRPVQPHIGDAPVVDGDGHTIAHVPQSSPATLGAMKLNLTADEVLTTTRSVRKRLDFDRPVDRATVEECLEIALQAPTGSNRQGWHWVVVEDADKKRAVAEVYQRNFEEYRSMPGAEYAAGRQPRRAPGQGARLRRLPVGQLPPRARCC